MKEAFFPPSGRISRRGKSRAFNFIDRFFFPRFFQKHPQHTPNPPGATAVQKVVTKKSGYPRQLLWQPNPPLFYAFQQVRRWVGQNFTAAVERREGIGTNLSCLRRFSAPLLVASSTHTLLATLQPANKLEQPRNGSGADGHYHQSCRPPVRIFMSSEAL